MIVVAQLPIARLAEGRRRMRLLFVLGLTWAASQTLTALVASNFSGTAATALFALVTSAFAIGECVHGALAEQAVEPEHGHEDPVADDVAVAALGDGALGRGRRLRDACEDDQQVRDERGAVDQEQTAEAPDRVRSRRSTRRGARRSRSAEPVDHRPGQRLDDEADSAVRRQHEPDRAEAEAADVVQVDEQERIDDPVAERVREAARLEDLDRPRKPRIQAGEIRAGHGTLTVPAARVSASDEPGERAPGRIRAEKSSARLAKVPTGRESTSERNWASGADRMVARSPPGMLAARAKPPLQAVFSTPRPTKRAWHTGDPKVRRFSGRSSRGKPAVSPARASSGRVSDACSPIRAHGIPCA